MTKQRPFYAVRVVVETIDDGSTVQQDFVRGESRMAKDAWDAFAIGTLVAMVMRGFPNEQPSIRVAIEQIDFETLRANRLYHHTTQAPHVG